MNDNRGLIENFLEAKYAEEGLSENSIFAYSSKDLVQAEKFCAMCRHERI